jgi:hypothetical protein
MDKNNNDSERIIQILNIMDKHSTRFEDSARSIITSLFIWLILILLIFLLICNYTGFTICKPSCKCTHNQLANHHINARITKKDLKRHKKT